jgi:predicted nucleotidyltransferase
VEILRARGARRVLLFGSAVDDPDQARDLDLAVEGIAPEDYFDTLGELEDELPVVVDLVDLSDDNHITRRIRKKGRVLYES